MDTKLTLEEARRIVAWLMRELELCAIGHGLIDFFSKNEELRKKQIEAWARVYATAIRTLLQETGLSTEWHSERDIDRGDEAEVIHVTSHIPNGEVRGMEKARARELTLGHARALQIMGMEPEKDEHPHELKATAMRFYCREIAEAIMTTVAEEGERDA